MAFIVFEGLDGSGKSTLLKELEASLVKRSQSYIKTREPGGTDLAESIRHLLLKKEGEAPTARAEALLYQASRAQHVGQVIQPALKRGDWVLCDRFRASSVAFQGSARGLGDEAIEWLNDFSTENLEPDLTVFIDVSVAESTKRIEARVGQTANPTQQQKDRMESEPQSFHEQVRASFQRQAAQKAKNWLVLDGSQTVEELKQQLMLEIERRFWDN